VDTLQTAIEDVQMARRNYPSEFKAHVVELVRSGRTPESLSRELEPSAEAIRAWVQAADEAVAGVEPAVDKDALIRELQRKLAIAEEEREILKKAAAWFAAESGSLPKRGSRS
jgi:transposase